ncbi:MAG: helix-turn-helix domain-containing protein [Bacteroidales bacterium]|jgi:transcriptional regulator with XRE-family HTH domain|nr:helix-turn-helix domain-containing protein [Bacteroidales bacterium]
MIEERIKQIMETYGLTAGGFAEILGIQASGISHILSGRNKPSLDFVTKVLIKFPEIDYNWLVLGKGSMKQMDKPVSNEPSLFDNEPVREIEEPKPQVVVEQPQEPLVEIEEPVEEPQQPVSKPQTKNERCINRIIVFYNDSTYEEISNK